jgi:hypothetical protein
MTPYDFDTRFSISTGKIHVHRSVRLKGLIKYMLRSMGMDGHS